MKSSRRLSMTISLLQVLFLIAVAGWHHVLEWYLVNHHLVRPDLLARYAGVPLDIVIKLNFPLSLLWAPILYLTRSYFSFSTSVVTVLLDIAILTSVGLFWYVVAAEIQVRSCGGSLIRSSKKWLEVPRAGVFLLLGTCAITYAFWDAHRLLLIGQLNNGEVYWSSMLDGIGGGLLLLVWAVVLIRSSIKDLKIALR